LATEHCLPARLRSDCIHRPDAIFHAQFWAEDGMAGRIALLATAAGVSLTGDIPLAILAVFSAYLHAGTAGFSGKLLTVVLMRPASLILLAMGIFYLWVYVRRDPAPSPSTEPGGSSQEPPAPTTAQSAG
jgi:hypothetical protein